MPHRSQRKSIDDAAESTARLLEPIVRLREKLSRPGGITREEAVTRALIGLEAQRPLALGAIETAILAISDTLNQQGETLDADTLGELLRKADDVHNVAGLYQLDELSKAAILLCALIERRPAKASLREAMRVFVSALRYFSTPQADARMAHAMLDELHRLVDHLQKPIFDC